MVDLQVPVHGHHYFVTMSALLLLHLFSLVPVCNVKIKIEHVVCSVVAKLTVLVLDLEMNGVNVLVHPHLVCEHLWAVRTWHICFSLISSATFCTHKMGFQLFEYFSTAMASLFVEVSMHLSVVDVYISFSATCEGTSSAGSKLSSMAILHVHPQHLYLCWAQGTLLLWLFVIQPLMNPQLNFSEHLCTDVTLSSSM